ncbi:MAG: hypothetical protein ACRENE_34300 [Polyangiaceae bacterium]
MGSNINKPTRSDRSRKMIAGVQKHLGSLSAIVVRGVSYTPAAVVKAMQGSIDAADTTATAAAAFHKATAAERETSSATDGLYRGMRAYLVNLYALQPDVLADFGIELANRQAPDASTVANAVAKRADTRVARHTMGKRQKQKVTGATAGATTAPAPAPAPAQPAPKGT